MSIEKCLVCDQCSAVIDGTTGSVKDMRRENRDHGGVTRGSKDYCPRCVKVGIRSQELSRTLDHLMPKK